jgi:hypothetical protein
MGSHALPRLSTRCISLEWIRLSSKQNLHNDNTSKRRTNVSNDEILIWKLSLKITINVNPYLSSSADPIKEHPTRRNSYLWDDRWD